MRIKNRQQVLLLIAIAGLVLLGSDRWIFSPLGRAWKQRTTRMADLKKSIAQGALLQDREQVIRQRWASMRTNTLPGNLSAAESQVFNAFYRWSQDSRFSLSSLQPQWRQNDDFMTLECRADGFGSLEALSRFLYEVEKGPPALRLEGVQITARDKDGQQLSLALQVSGLWLEPAPQP